MWDLDGMSNRVFLVGSLALASWGVLQLVDALRGPPRPEWVPADFTAVNRGVLYSRALQGIDRVERRSDREEHRTGRASRRDRGNRDPRKPVAS